MNEDRKHLSIIIDKDGNPWGPFDSSVAAATWANEKWPDQEQDEDHADNLAELGAALG